MVARPSRLAAVVLNFRTPEQTWLAVKSLLASCRPIDDLIVVNNDGPATEDQGLRTYTGLRTADCGPRTEDRGPRTSLRVLETGRNLGFSGGMNIGIRAALDAGTDRVLVVNSDVTVPPGCVEALEQCLESTPKAGIVGPVIIARSNPSQVVSLGMSYSDVTGRMRHQGFLTPASLKLPESSLVDAVAGCLMLISREVFEAVGLFDEDYFFSFEDLDFCLKARRAGFVTLLAGQASVYHEGGGTMGKDSRRLYFASRNHLLVAARSDPSASPLMRVLRESSIVVLNLAHALAAAGGSPVVRVSAVVRGTADYFAGRLGEGDRASGQSLRQPRGRREP
ncbi:MAG: glycosyltransferase family 2 protein [Vicinamibacterales bacterium]